MKINWLSLTPFAHRGLHDGNSVPENSLLSFKRAIDNNYGIEFDIRILSDKTVIVFHDKSLERMTGLAKRISQLTIEDVKKQNLLNTEQIIPTLSEALEFINGRVPILIEIKNESRVGKFEKIVLNTLASYKGTYALQSFNPFSLIWFKYNAPQIPRGLIWSNYSNSKYAVFIAYALKYLSLNWLSKPHFYSFDIRALPIKDIQQSRFKGVPVLSWTISNYEELNKARRYSNNIIFENIDPAL